MLKDWYSLYLKEVLGDERSHGLGEQGLACRFLTFVVGWPGKASGGLGGVFVGMMVLAFSGDFKAQESLTECPGLSKDLV